MVESGQRLQVDATGGCPCDVHGIHSGVCTDHAGLRRGTSPQTVGWFFKHFASYKGTLVPSVFHFLTRDMWAMSVARTWLWTRNDLAIVLLVLLSIVVSLNRCFLNRGGGRREKLDLCSLALETPSTGSQGICPAFPPSHQYIM